MIRFIVEPLIDIDGFLTAYHGLFNRKTDATIFQSPGWIESWLAEAPSTVNLWRVEAVCKDSTELLGVIGAPKKAALPVTCPRTAHLFEFGSPAHDAVYTEYNDFLVADGASPELRAGAIKAILGRLSPLDEFVVRNAREPLAETACIVAAARGAGFRIINEQPIFDIDLGGLRAARQDYLESRSASFQSQIRRASSLYQQRGDLCLTIAATNDERDRAWNNLVRLHETAWKEKGGGVFDNQALTAFHNRFRTLMPEDAQLLELRAGGDVIAVLYNLVFGSRVCNYQSGVKFEPDNRLKPGLLAHALAAQIYLDWGFSVYDLLAGDAPYKRRLGDEGEKLTSFVVDCGGGIGAKARQAIRRVRSRMRS